MQRNNKLFKFLSILLIISSLILSSVSILAGLTLSLQRMEYFNRENIHFEKFHVEMRDGVKIYSLLYINKNLFGINNNSVPTILMLNGINSRKENNIFKAFQLVKLGYAIISVEQRGHGESGGPSSFLDKEPYDMVEIINYIENNFEFANISYIGLLAFSYGGGIGAILQALDNRIHASVLYHPLSSLNSMLINIPLQNLIGSTPSITDIEKIQDAYDLATENNTKNLLLLHGLDDTLIFPQDTINFYQLLNGGDRTDIVLKLRPNLDHVTNENSLTSLKYTLLWLEHFYHNYSIDISNLENEIINFELHDLTYPKGFISEILLIISSILLFIGLSIIFLTNKIIPYWETLPLDQSPFSERIAAQRYNKMIIYRSIFYVVPSIFVGFFCFIFNTSLLYGYFILFPLISIILMLFISSELHLSWKHEWKKWLKYDLKLFTISIIIIIIPIVIFLLIYNLNALVMIKPVISIFNNSFGPYILIGMCSGILDYFYLREFNPKHTYIILIIRPISLLLFVLFVPIQPFPLLGGLVAHIIFFLLFGVITFYIRQLVMIFSKFYKNEISLYFLVMFPFIILYALIFFRII
jgi:alpha/beta superfamily hydrolase